MEKNKYNTVTNKFEKLKTNNILFEILKLFLIFSLIYIMQEFLNGSNTIFIFKNINVLAKKYELKNVLSVLCSLTIFNTKYYLSVLLLIVISILIYAITNRKKASLIFIGSIVLIYSLINYLVTQIRGSSITIYDILSIKTALNVSKNITFNIDSNIIIAMFLFIVSTLFIVYFYGDYTKKQKRVRIMMLVVCIMLLILITNTSTIREIRIWDTQKSYSENGIVLTMLKLITNINYKEPENYSKYEVEEILNEYDYNTDDNKEYNPDTNIIVVMNESFADFYKNKYLDIYEDNIPFFHALQNEENTITGVMHSEGYGSDTANVEYEFLTQNSVAFMPDGAIPYQQYIRKNLSSIVSKMNSLNYTTYGMHLWKKGGYNRENIYKLLEFDYALFKENYDNLKYTVNGYTADESSYSKIMEIFNNKEKNEKIFFFNLTMQNHLPYTELDDSQITYSSQNTLNIYLQMQNYSDKALEELIEYLKKYDEKVILLFFGDHQPNVDIDDLKNDEENKYKVPYLIWANYEIESKDYGEISTNYLQSILIETANLPKDEYTNYMIQLREEIPVITSHYYIGNDGNKYKLDDTNSPYYSKIKEYEKISYYKLKNFSE